MNIFTIGHSTHSKLEFLAILKTYDIERLVDVRSYPGSRYMPHFNQENMKQWLPESNIEYFHMPDLGGRRRKNKEIDESIVAGWRHVSFRNYAAYALSNKYDLALDKLIQLAKEKRVCYMCAESVPWRCHRSIISNNLVLKGWTVHHIIDGSNEILHIFGKYGAKPVVEGNQLIYPLNDEDDIGDS